MDKRTNEEYKELRKNIALESVVGRSFKCNFCHRSYKYKLSLTKHVEEMHGETTKVDKARRCNNVSTKKVSVITRNPNF